MDIIIPESSMREMKSKIKEIIGKKMDAAVPVVQDLLFKKAVEMAADIHSSPEWGELTGKLVGEFGFAPYEMQKFSEVIKMLIPLNSPVVKLEVMAGVNNKYAILHWVDWQKLAWSDAAQHYLTHWNGKSRSFEVDQIVSWIEWLEEGITVRDYIFDDHIGPKSRFFSRSGQGLMRHAEGGLWHFAPTKLFERTAHTFDIGSVKRGIAQVFKRKA